MLDTRNKEASPKSAGGLVSNKHTGSAYIHDPVLVIRRLCLRHNVFCALSAESQDRSREEGNHRDR